MSILLLGLRAVSQLRFFTQFRVLILLIKQTVSDMTVFTVIMGLIIFLMSVANGVNKLDGVTAKKTEKVWDHFP